MPRTNWLDEDTDLPLIDEHAQQLEHFASSMADGVIDNAELSKQQEALVAAMKAVEGELSDELHAKVTTLLIELAAFNTMQILHDLARARVRAAFAGA